MGKLFQTADGILCRSCGATQARPEEDAPDDVCFSCWARFTSVCRNAGVDPTEDRLNKWLARQLYLNARRLKIFGVMGRCEAISGVDANLYVQGLELSGGYQCGMHASMMRDGRRVCASHGQRATYVSFVCEALTSPYDDFARMLAELALIDEDFLACIRRGVECAEAIKTVTPEQTK